MKRVILASHVGGGGASEFGTLLKEVKRGKLMLHLGYPSKRGHAYPPWGMYSVPAVTRCWKLESILLEILLCDGRIEDYIIIRRRKVEKGI